MRRQRVILTVLAAAALILSIACSMYPNWERSGDDAPPAGEGGDWECWGDCDPSPPSFGEGGDWECWGDCDGGTDGDGDVDGDADSDGDADTGCRQGEMVRMCIHPDDGSDPYEDYVCPDDVPGLIEHGDYLGECRDPVDPPPEDIEPDGDADSDADGDVDGDADSDGDADGTCDVPECREDKELVCHVPPGNPGNAHWLCVGAPAIRAHERHGDGPSYCCEP